MEAVRIFPNHTTARINLANVYLAKGRLDDAIAQLKKAIADKPDSAVAVFNLAKGLELRAVEKKRSRDRAGAERDFEAAAEVYRRSLELRPEHAKSIFGLGLCLHRIGRCDEAVPLLQRYLEAVPRDHAARGILGDCLFRQGKYHDAEKSIRLFLKAYPESKSGRRILNQIQAKEG